MKKSFSIYIVKFFELYISAVLLPFVFCCFVEIKIIPLWSLFLIVYLHLQWNAVLTQTWKKKGGGGSALNIFSIFYTHHRIPNQTHDDN
jgi:hypothetical protein